MKFQEWLFNHEVDSIARLVVETTDNELVAAIRSGNEAAWEPLLRKWEPRLKSYLNFHCKGMDIDDIAQEVLSQIVKSLQQNADIRDFDKWIYTVAKSKIANYCRQKGRAPMVSGDMDMDVYPSTTIDKKDDSSDIQQALNALALQGHMGERKSSILSRHFLNGEKLADIARDMGLPVGTVKRSLFQAKRDMRNLLPDFEA